MNTVLKEAAREKMRSVFVRFPELEKVVLYGSRAKGNFKPGSDIDLTLFGAALTADTLASISIALDDLLLPYTIDLSRHESLDNAELREHIKRVGVVLYQQQQARTQT